MNKYELVRILGEYGKYRETPSKSALIVDIETPDLDVMITIPYEVHEIFFEARDKSGFVLLVDSQECYGENEQEDYKELLMDVEGVLKQPKFRITNSGKTVEAMGYKWYYFFGKFNS